MVVNDLIESSKRSYLFTFSNTLLSTKLVSYLSFNAKSVGFNNKQFFLLSLPFIQNHLEIHTILDISTQTHYFKIHIDSDCTELSTVLFFFLNMYPKNNYPFLSYNSI